jgi:hypothetical protein
MREGENIVSDSVRVLLVNETTSDASHIVTYLKNLGCPCALSRSVRESCALLHREQFDLVLSKFEVPGGDCHALSALLIGRKMSLFYFFAVEGGCWWIPCVCREQECRGESALRPGEFLRALKELITDVVTSHKRVCVDRERLGGSHSAFPLSEVRSVSACNPGTPFALRHSRHDRPD